MNDPLSFAAALLSQEGGLVEQTQATLEAVLPAALGQRFGLAEHVVLAEGEEAPAGVRRVGYGTELLERLVSAATSRVAVASGRVRMAPVRDAQASQAAQGFMLRNGVVAAGSARPFAARRLWLHATYSLQSDERREGLSSAVVSVYSGTLVQGFEEAVAGALEPAAPAALSGRDAARAVLAATRGCSRRAEAEAASFGEAMARRFERDRDRLEDYFADLTGELTRRASKGRLDRAAVEEKRQVLARERAAKLEALEARYQLRLEVRPVAALVVEAGAFLVPVELRRRKAARAIELEYDCATRRLVAPACEGCAGPAPRPAACDGALHLLCETCVPKAEGRVDCPACGRGRSERALVRPVPSTNP